jgi:hypothetical protein
MTHIESCSRMATNYFPSQIDHPHPMSYQQPMYHQQQIGYPKPMRNIYNMPPGLNVNIYYTNNPHPEVSITYPRLFGKY